MHYHPIDQYHFHWQIHYFLGILGPHQLVSLVEICEPILRGDRLSCLSLIAIPVLCVAATLLGKVLSLAPLVLRLILAQVIILSAGTGWGLGWLIFRKSNHHNGFNAVRIVPNVAPALEVDSVVPPSVVVLVPGHVGETNSRALQAVSSNDYSAF